MLQNNTTLKFTFLLAVLLHAALFLLLFFHQTPHSFSLTQHAAGKKIKIVHVTSVSEEQVNKQVADILHQQQRKRAKKVAIRQEKIRVAKARLAKRLKAQKILRERKYKARLEKARKQKARKQKAAALLAKQKKLQDKLMQQQMHHEQQKLQQLATAAMQGAVNKYKAKILSLIQSNWRIHEVNAKLKCQYQVSVGPGGVVLAVKLLKASGNVALDQSARAAILQSSPLPVPNNPALFDHFRQLVLTLSPHGYL